jgi:hypothetical protein
MKIVLPAYRADSVHRGGQQKGLVRVEEHPHEPHPRADGLEAHDSEFVSHQVEGRQSASDKSHDGDALVFIEPFAIPSNLIPSRPKNLAEHLGVADLCGGQRGRLSSSRATPLPSVVSSSFEPPCENDKGTPETAPPISSTIRIAKLWSVFGGGSLRRGAGGGRGGSGFCDFAWTPSSFGVELCPKGNDSKATRSPSSKARRSLGLIDSLTSTRVGGRKLGPASSSNRANMLGHVVASSHHSSTLDAAHDGDKRRDSSSGRTRNARVST